MSLSSDRAATPPTGSSMPEYRADASGNDAATLQTMMRYNEHRKSAGVAYILWLFLAYFSGHRFYLGRTGSAIAQTALFLVSALLTAASFTIGAVALLVWVGWSLVDAFLIPGMVRRHNEALMSRLAAGQLP